MSDDFATKTKGGLLGWRSVDALGVGKVVSDAVKAMEPGTTSDVIKTPTAYYIVKLEQKSDAALTFDNMQNILADRVIRDELADAVTKQAAEEALAKSETKNSKTSLKKASSQDSHPALILLCFSREIKEASSTQVTPSQPNLLKLKLLKHQPPKAKRLPLPQAKKWQTCHCHRLMSKHQA